MAIEIDKLNYLAIEILESLKVDKPSEEQINLMETVVSTLAFSAKVIFNGGLTQREISCLYLTSKGKTSQEIAKIFQIQKYTVNEYKKSILNKLNCKSMAQAVFEGIRFGYLRQTGPIER